MFKSVQKSGRIAAVAIGLIAALSPLAAPPAALAGGSVPTPELEKSYSFKTSSDNSYIDVIDIDSEYCYLFNRDDENNLKKVSLINMNDGITTANRDAVTAALGVSELHGTKIVPLEV